MTRNDSSLTTGFDLSDEFWWLDLADSTLDATVKVGRSGWAPIEDDPPWLVESEPVKLRNLVCWALTHGFVNLHRSFKLQHPDGHTSSGPYMFDVDIDERFFSDSSQQPPDELLALARDVTVECLGFLDSVGVSPEKRRVYFSGHKGFRIEFVIEGASSTSAEVFERFLKSARNAATKVGGEKVIVDKYHPLKRLNGTVNEWGQAADRRRHICMRLRERKLSTGDTADLWNVSATPRE